MVDAELDDKAYYHQESFVAIAQMERYTIEHVGAWSESKEKSFWIKVKNVTALSYRVGYLAGPFALYVDLSNEAFDHSAKYDDDEVAYTPLIKSNLQSQQSFYMEVPLQKGGENRRICWVLNIVSEVLFNKKAQVSFELALGPTKHSLRSKQLRKVKLFNDGILKVTRHTTQDLWAIPNSIKTVKTKIHLVVLTHGVHSNVTTDMLYLKEQIERMCRANSKEHEICVVDGFKGNVGETERGIRNQGINVAKYIAQELFSERVKKISFIGHSLGGVVQTFAIAYLAIMYPDFFNRVSPVNFITMASPLLGISVKGRSNYINYSLNAGLMGQTGLDLNLAKDNANDGVPLLYSLSGDPVHSILQRFQRRTIYCNAIHDGIVPLYTSSLLYLDYEDVLAKLYRQTDHAINKNAKQAVKKLPKSSAIGSMTSMINVKRPRKQFIMDPESRTGTIVHDKLYTPQDIERVREQYRDTLLRKHIGSRITSERNTSEPSMLETMANNWHEGIEWRKVVVAIQSGDAHNNMVVRREFGNAYGWPVVDHLLENHFAAAVTGAVVSSAVGDHETASASNQPPQNVDPNKLYSWITRVDRHCSNGLLPHASNLLERSFR
ncbi:putative lipase KNAG_0A05570 [Huiozyma naganishii CBS 8797]|uniref:DUF676 domain-containing protein n=1 Tax=Huiozyma naganishii (strain ATCC MYA-139 / BCRC 22969 / CBS 8797 / KCTC 17520 / NBRC 10181 / NCYC 3082 / Yp74L-3) TaxID=1071383 RepID=J7S3W1_HUIN7|nr:hypothetical protein KNAG_0A05570 [Kazachstania naganishii CBS 8797]CCK68221.1 hypothetical protein KNAG_0A05570 [Kazachstania naganishii CBS 8797]